MDGGLQLVEATLGLRPSDTDGVFTKKEKLNNACLTPKI